jgi:hypothetical protein
MLLIPDRVILINKNQITFYCSLKFIRSKGFSFFFLTKEFGGGLQLDQMNLLIFKALLLILLLLAKMVSLVDLMLKENIAWRLPRMQ